MKLYNIDLGLTSPSASTPTRAAFDVFQWCDKRKNPPAGTAADRPNTIALTLNLANSGVVVDRNRTSRQTTLQIKKSLASVEIGGEYVVKIPAGTLTDYFWYNEDVNRDQHALMTVMGITVHLRFDNETPPEHLRGHFAENAIVEEARIDILLVNADLCFKRVRA